MDKRLMAIAAGMTYEAFASTILYACPLPRDQVSATCFKECRDEQHIERDIAVSTANTTATVTVIITAGPIMPGNGALTLTSFPQFVTTYPAVH